MGFYYNPCPFCGLNLDPGEKCDCKDQAEEPEAMEYCMQCGELLSEDDVTRTVDGVMCEGCFGMLVEEAYISEMLEDVTKYQIHGNARMKRERQAYEEAEREGTGEWRI